MKNKKKEVILMVALSLFIYTAQYAQQFETASKVTNHLKGDLDYTYEALDLIQKLGDGSEISLGKINTDGTIKFELPAYDIKALYDSINLQQYNFQQAFKMDSNCKDRDVSLKTYFDEVYWKKHDPIYVKKYGINIAALYPVSNEEIVSRKNNKAIFPEDSKYFWFYIDRDIAYRDECIKSSSWGNDDIELAINANIRFEKGWNFIEENLVEVQDVGEGDSRTTRPKKIHFTKISPASKKVKWVLKQIQEDEKIQTAKYLHELTPITKKQFEKWTPKNLGDLSVTTQEHGNLPRGQRNKNNMHLIYKNESQKKEIDLYVVDCAKSPDDMEMINFAYAMDNHGKDSRDIKPYIIQYNEEADAIQLYYKAEDRIIVNASAVNIKAEELWAYIQKMNVRKLLSE